ncbi:hypothetical protein COLO4_08275 [Corchorus olitorius]|uniref:Uncharacterized protein n=1 Tax=Corchorus olitorius TaxID=93759 RepID=A0A1R3KGJ1_9ROSI|nr:hypothetical protein COLO4_08275 [Corchorus olitorius]
MVAKTALRFASAANGAVLSTSSSKSTPKVHIWVSHFLIPVEGYTEHFSIESKVHVAE